MLTSSLPHFLTILCSPLPEPLRVRSTSELLSVRSTPATKDLLRKLDYPRIHEFVLLRKYLATNFHEWLTSSHPHSLPAPVHLKPKHHPNTQINVVLRAGVVGILRKEMRVGRGEAEVDVFCQLVVQN